MKLLIASIFSLFNLLLHAQTYSGSLTLSSQAELDSFNYTEVLGSLSIQGADINDLSNLNMLTSVNGDIVIQNNDLLINIDSFNNLVSLGGGVLVYDNPKLSSFAGFNKLKETGDNIDFWYNDSLASITAFPALVTAGWSLEFGGNPMLEKLPDLPMLETISSSLFVMDNTGLKDISGLKSLKYVDWSFNVSGNTSLADLCGIYNLLNITQSYSGNGTFDVSNNDASLPVSSSVEDILAAGPCKSSISMATVMDEVKALALSKSDANSILRALKSAERLIKRSKIEKAKLSLDKAIGSINSLMNEQKIESSKATGLVDMIKLLKSSL